MLQECVLIALIQRHHGVGGKDSQIALLLSGEPKYGPGSKPHWKAVSARYPAFYKALLDEPFENQED